MTIQATLLVCDDIRLEWNGKAIIVGLYTSDLTIPFEPFVITQLQFFLIFECTLAEKPSRIRFEVTLPKQAPVHWDFLVPEIAHVPEGRTKFHLRQPFSVMNVQLMAGQIKAKVTYADGEIELSGPWIVQVPPPGAGALNQAATTTEG